MGPVGSPETSVKNYHRSLRFNPEERSSHLLRAGSLKSRKFSYTACPKSFEVIQRVPKIPKVLFYRDPN
jgi:hypothetical protein